MRRVPTLLTMTALVFALAMPHGAALHCNGEIITIGSGDTALYLDDRSSSPGDINHWIYLESNDQEGLQSGYESWICNGGGSAYCWLVTLSDRCNHADPDLFIF